MGVRKI